MNTKNFHPFEHYLKHEKCMRLYKTFLDISFYDLASQFQIYDQRFAFLPDKSLHSTQLKFSMAMIALVCFRFKLPFKVFFAIQNM